MYLGHTTHGDILEVNVIDTCYLRGAATLCIFKMHHWVDVTYCSELRNFGLSSRVM